MREKKSSSVHLSHARGSKGKGAPVGMLKCSKIVRTEGRETSLLVKKAGKATVCAARKPSHPNKTPMVACHQPWYGKSRNRDLFVGRPELKVEHGHQQRGVHLVCVEQQLVGESGDIRTMTGEHNLSGSVIHRHGLSQLTAGFYRLPHLRIDVVDGAEGEHQVRRYCRQVSAPAQCAAR